MYWPLGAASVYAPPEDNQLSGAGEALRNSAFVSLSRTSSGNLLAAVTEHELFIWQTQVTSPYLFGTNRCNSPLLSLLPSVDHKHLSRATAITSKSCCILRTTRRRRRSSRPVKIICSYTPSRYPPRRSSRAINSIHRGQLLRSGVAPLLVPRSRNLSHLIQFSTAKPSK